VERIGELKITGRTFEPPDNFNPEEKLETAFDLTHDEPIEVKVWFSRNQARYIKERRWARDQKITDRKDGSIIFEMTTSGWWDVKSWVMKYGADARVLEPEGLRREIIDDLKVMQDNYLQEDSRTEKS